MSFSTPDGSESLETKVKDTVRYCTTPIYSLSLSLYILCQSCLHLYIIYSIWLYIFKFMQCLSNLYVPLVFVVDCKDEVNWSCFLGDKFLVSLFDHQDPATSWRIDDAASFRSTDFVVQNAPTKVGHNLNKHYSTRRTPTAWAWILALWNPDCVWARS